MILSTHAVVGTAIAKVVPMNPLLGFALAFLSHFAMDAIPHWEYRILSYDRNPKNYLKSNIRIDKTFAFDLGRTGLDLSIGMLFSLLLFPPSPDSPILINMLGIAGGVLPDFLQLVYYKTKVQPFTSLQKFHVDIHSKRPFKNMPLGVAVQTTIVGSATFLQKLFS